MIRKARKKPVEIEWISFNDLEKAHYNIENAFIISNKFFNIVSKLETNPKANVNEFLISTLEGTMKMTCKDVLIIGVRGEIYPCKIDIFKETYEVI
jgi:hypothetical protein